MKVKLEGNQESLKHSIMELECKAETAGKPLRCKAAVARKAGEPLVIEEIDVAPPKEWEVRIKIVCTSLCHSDVTLWKLDAGPTSFFPRIFGHEAAGVVESVGEHVEEVKPGDKVIPIFQRNCEECRDCKSQKGNFCSKFPVEFFGGMPRDGSNRFTDMSGQTLHHFFSVSSFSEYTVVDITHLVKISPEIPLEKACLLSCGVTTGIGAACKFAEVDEGSTVAIFGLGAVGLAVAAGSKLCRAAKIIGVDLNPEKFEIGKKFGVTDFINPASCGEKSVSQVIKEMTGGGADYSFECIGLASLMGDAFDSSRPGGGKTIVLGVEMHRSPLCIDTYDLLRGRMVTGCLFGGVKPKSEISSLKQRYLDRELNLEAFITHEVNFKDINKAFDLLDQGKSLRCIIWMDS